MKHNKKIISGSLIAIASIGFGLSYADVAYDKYDQEINKGLSILTDKFSEKGLDLSYGEKKISLLNDDIAINDVLIKHKFLKEPIKIKQFIIDRNSFNVDENGVHSYVKFKIDDGSVNLPLININDTFDMDYLYFYDEELGRFIFDFNADFKKSAKASVNVEFDNAESVWNYPFTNRDKNGKILSIKNSTMLKSAIGDLTLNRFSINFEDKELINELAKVFSLMTKGDSTAEPEEIRYVFASDIRNRSHSDDKLAKEIANLIEKSGRLEIQIQPKNPLLIKDVIEKIEDHSKNNSTQIDVLKYIESVSNLSIKHEKHK